MKPRFENVSCSQCGRDFGPGDHGFSACRNHQVKLEVGRTYKNGWGALVRIVWKGEEWNSLARDEIGYGYHYDGVMARYDMDDRFNLIEEVNA